MLPVSVRSRFLEVQIQGFSQDELSEIIARRSDSARPGTVPAIQMPEAKKLATVYCKLQNQCTMREIIKWVRRYHMFSQAAPATSASWPLAGLSILAPRYQPGSEAYTKLADAFKDGTGWSKAVTAYDSRPVKITQTAAGVHFAEGPLSVVVPGSQLDNSPLFQQGRCPPAPFQRSLAQMAFAISNREPVLLVGPSSYKTLLVSTWAELQGRASELIKVHLAPDTEASELVGQIQPSSFADLLLSLPVLAMELLTCLAALESQPADAQYDDIAAVQDAALRKSVEDLACAARQEVDHYTKMVLARPASDGSRLSRSSMIDAFAMVSESSSLKGCMLLFKAAF